MRAMFPFIHDLYDLIRKEVRYRLRAWEDLNFKQDSILLDKYQILQKIGMGSYGVSYLCEDLLSKNKCVLKRVAPIQGGKDRAINIFEQEIYILRRINHPKIPAFYKSFRYNNHLCFTMEFIEGNSLQELLFQKNKMFSEKDSLLIARKLLNIVADLHALGIVHRDISISNVIVYGEDVHLIDFGLARELNPSESVNILEDDDCIGLYTPMEKKLRRGIHVSSDFYAIGHLLLFLLYSTYTETSTKQKKDLGWEEELSLYPHTKKLLRRLLQAEQPYSHTDEILHDIDQILLLLD